MKRILLSVAAALAVGCGTAEPEPSEPPPPPMNDPHSVDFVKLGEGQLAPAPPVSEAPWANRRRMDIDQLEASFLAVTGLVWENTQGQSQFEELSSTLGKPDYIDSTQEDLTVSLLFQKFLGDAARNVCERRAQGESDGEFDALLLSHVDATMTWDSHPEEVDMNLQELLLRFHGQSIDPSTERMSPWRWLFTSTTHVSGDPVVAWRAVCIGLLTHPDFYSY